MRFNIYASYTSDIFIFIRLRMEAERAGKVPSVAEILFYFILGLSWPADRPRRHVKLTRLGTSGSSLGRGL